MESLRFVRYRAVRSRLLSGVASTACQNVILALRTYLSYQNIPVRVGDEFQVFCHGWIHRERFLWWLREPRYGTAFVFGSAFLRYTWIGMLLRCNRISRVFLLLKRIIYLLQWHGISLLRVAVGRCFCSTSYRRTKEFPTAGRPRRSSRCLMFLVRFSDRKSS